MQPIFFQKCQADGSPYTANERWSRSGSTRTSVSCLCSCTHHRACEWKDKLDDVECRIQSPYIDEWPNELWALKRILQVLRAQCMKWCVQGCIVAVCNRTRFVLFQDKSILQFKTGIYALSADRGNKIYALLFAMVNQCSSFLGHFTIVDMSCYREMNSRDLKAAGRKKIDWFAFRSTIVLSVWSRACFKASVHPPGNLPHVSSKFMSKNI